MKHPTLSNNKTARVVLPATNNEIRYVSTHGYNESLPHVVLFCSGEVSKWQLVWQAHIKPKYADRSEEVVSILKYFITS